MLALIDGDIVAYRCAATAEKRDKDGNILSLDPEWVATSRANTLMEQILEEVKASEYKIFLTGLDNFREVIYPEYKANRKGKPRPEHLGITKEFLAKTWNAETVHGMEADDALGINQEDAASYGEMIQGGDKYHTVICSIDKDLKQIPGLHYNFVKKEWDEISELQGWYNFYIQLLIGDPGDNIRGCPGIGKAKAPRILEGCTTEQEMFDAVRSIYMDDDAMFLNGQLLYILREENQYWQPEKLIRHEAEIKSESTQKMEGVTIPSTERGLTH